MKKLFFTLALLVSVIALSAQNFPFQVTDEEGNVIENNGTYYIYGDGGDMGIIEIKFQVTNTSDETLTLIAEKEEINVVEGTENYFCFGFCFPSSVYVGSPYDLEPGSGDEWSFHYIPYDAETGAPVFGEQVMIYSLYERNNPDNKFILNVTFKYSEDGIVDNTCVDEFSNAYPMPASNVVNFDYNFASSVDAEVAIYNMMGQEVMRNRFSGMNGKLSINVSDLTDGVYFYSLIVNGKTEKSNKLVIRK